MNRRSIRHRNVRRKGSVLVLTALMMVAMVAMLAFAIDIGYLQMARAQLQQSADAAALAAAAELVDNEAPLGYPDLTDEALAARLRAVEYAALNQVCRSAPLVDSNLGNNQTGGVVLGYLADPSDRSQSMSFSDPQKYNAVQVRVSRTSSENGQVPFFFARAFGVTGVPTEATATAALINNVQGFRTPRNNTNLPILPFALDLETWDLLMAGGGTDAWRWDSASQTVSAAPDGIREVNLYPQGTGSPGNRGTVDVGSSNNSTADIARQIVYGVSPSDMSYIGGELKLNAQGLLYLNGDTGISAGFKEELDSIRGQPRVIPVFNSVAGSGNNAEYTICQFAGVRVMDVVLTGAISSKRVIIQPANVITAGAINSSGPQKSTYIYSPVWLVR